MLTWLTQHDPEVTQEQIHEDIKKYVAENDIKDRIKAEKTIKFLVDNADLK